jgi:hypothetical protein
MKTLTLAEIVTKAVQQGQLSRHLFKYRKINLTLDSILIDGKLWFSNPSDFNDPFDCQINIDTNNSQTEIEEFIRKNSSWISPIEITRHAKAMICKPDEWDKLVNEASQNVLNSSGICCFCGNEDNILLWSYYTDSHKGVCLKFDILSDPDFFVYPLKVIYQKEYPLYNHLKDEPKLIDFLVKTKSEVWAHEKEVRIMKNTNGFHTFKKTALTEIIFGCNCSDTDIQRIKNLALTNGYTNTTFKKAVLKKFEYGMDFVNV